MKSIACLLPYLQDDVVGFKAIINAVFPDNSVTKSKVRKQYSKLPYYGEVLADYVSSKNESSNKIEERYGKLANPTLHVALNQLRVVVNELIMRFGVPVGTYIQIAPDLSFSANRIQNYNTQQKEKRRLSEDISQQLLRLGVGDNYDNRLRLRLFNEMGDNPTCIYSGVAINLDNLFTEKITVDNILPLGLSFDDRIRNKLLVTTKSHLHKNRRYPFQAFGHNPKKYSWPIISANANKLPSNTKWRFSSFAMDMLHDTHTLFMEKKVFNKSYYAQLVREYLSCVKNNDKNNTVNILSGYLTNYLRRAWRLDDIFPNCGSERHAGITDYRFHTINAIVVALTHNQISAAGIDRVTSAEKTMNVVVFEVEPWSNFLKSVSQAVRRVNVSHKPDHGVQGSLHDTTAYGLCKNEKHVTRRNDIRRVVRRIPIKTIKTTKTIDKIRDLAIRDAFHKATAGAKREDFTAAIIMKASTFSPKIRRVRITENLKVITVQGKRGVDYKAYRGNANYCYDIWVNQKGKWEGRVVSIFEANQKKHVWELNPIYKSNTTLMRIRKNDYIQVEMDDGVKLMRVCKFSSGIINLTEHFEANSDARIRNKLLKAISKSPNALHKINARYATVSPSGLLTVKKYS